MTRPWGPLIVASALAGCGTSAAERYTCSDQAGAGCECATDADCVLTNCSPSVQEFECDPECPCTNGWPVNVEEAAALNDLSVEQSCGPCERNSLVGHCLRVNCDPWWTLEPRCELGRCVGVRVDE